MGIENFSRVWCLNPCFNYTILEKILLTIVCYSVKAFKLAVTANSLFKHISNIFINKIENNIYVDISLQHIRRFACYEQSNSLQVSTCIIKNARYIIYGETRGVKYSYANIYRCYLMLTSFYAFYLFVSKKYEFVPKA